MRETATKRKLTPLIIILALLGVLCLAAGYFISRAPKEDGKAQRENALAVFLENGRGVGKATVSLCFAPDGETVTGAAVVCQGGNDPYVRAEVVRLLSAALNVRTNRIYVSGGD